MHVLGANIVPASRGATDAGWGGDAVRYQGELVAIIVRIQGYSAISNVTFRLESVRGYKIAVKCSALSICFWGGGGLKQTCDVHHFSDSVREMPSGILVEFLRNCRSYSLWMET